MEDYPIKKEQVIPHSTGYDKHNINTPASQKEEKGGGGLLV